MVPPITEQSPLLAQRHEPPFEFAAVQHTVPEHEDRLPLAYIVQSQSPAFAPVSHLITVHVHVPEEGQPGSAQQMPGAPSTEGLHGTELEGPAVSHEHEPSTLTYMSLQEMPPPPEEEPEPEPEPEPEEEEEPDDPPEPPPEDPDEELADVSCAPPSVAHDPASGSHAGLPLLPEHPPPGTTSTIATAAAESTRPSARRIGALYALREPGLPRRQLDRSRFNSAWVVTPWRHAKLPRSRTSSTAARNAVRATHAAPEPMLTRATPRRARSATLGEALLASRPVRAGPRRAGGEASIM